METIKELEQKIKNIHEEEFASLKKLYNEFIESDKANEYDFEFLIQKILLYAFGVTHQKAFYICYATGDLYNTPEVQLNGNLYNLYLALSNGDMKRFTTAYKLEDANFYIDKIDVYTKRKQIVHDWFIAAFSNDPAEIATVGNYDELHKNLTNNIIEFACTIIRLR